MRAFIVNYSHYICIRRWQQTICKLQNQYHCTDTRGGTGRRFFSTLCHDELVSVILVPESMDFIMWSGYHVVSHAVCKDVTKTPDSYIYARFCHFKKRSPLVTRMYTRDIVLYHTHIHAFQWFGECVWNVKYAHSTQVSNQVCRMHRGSFH